MHNHYIKLWSLNKNEEKITQVMDCVRLPNKIHVTKYITCNRDVLNFYIFRHKKNKIYGYF
jgi:hypothetical protein